MDFQDNEFDVIFDKGTLDAIFTDNKTYDDVLEYFKECARILDFGGKFVCVSLAQEHIVAAIVEFFNTGFEIHVHCIEQKQQDSSGFGSKLPVFVFIIIKIKENNCKHCFKHSTLTRISKKLKKVPQKRVFNNNFFFYYY